MKDFITTIGLLIVGIGIFAAAPAFGIVVGAGLGIWFLHHIIKEYNQEQNNVNKS